MNVTGLATKTAMMTAMRDTVASGSLELLSAGGAVLAIFALSASAGTISGSSSVAWTLGLASGGATTGEAGAGSGTNATSARIKTAGGVVQFTLTLSLTGGGGEVILDNVSITSGQNVTISTATVTWP